MQVIVFRNLNNNPIWEIVIKENGKWKILDKVNYLLLENTEFIVHNIVKDNNHPKVHAWISGHIIDSFSGSILVEEVGYNPYRNISFVKKNDNSPIFRADLVIFNRNSVWVLKN